MSRNIMSSIGSKEDESSNEQNVAPTSPKSTRRSRVPKTPRMCINYVKDD